MKRSSMLGIALVLLVRMAPAATPEEPTIGQFIPMMCPAMVQQLAGPPQMFSALKSGKLDSEAVCSCASESFIKDAQVAKLADLDPEELERWVGRSEVIMSYVALRAIHSIMNCVAADLDKQLEDVILPTASAEPAAEPAIEPADAPSRE